MTNKPGQQGARLEWDMDDRITITDEEFRYLAGYIKKTYGINLTQKRVLLEGRLNSYLLQKGYRSYTEYIRAVKSDPSGREITNLINKITTNHTFFMREAEHFHFLQDTVLPQLEQTVRDHDLRIWCAASSTGEESYTLAMILEDYFGGKLPPWDKRLLATDLSQKVLEQAYTGIYPIEGTAGIPEEWRTKYFHKYDEKHLQITQHIRSQVFYRPFNLMDPIVVKKPFHVIFCRNVMIYFDAATKAGVVERLYNAMAPGGYLFVGQTETIARPTRFSYVKPSIYQKGTVTWQR